VSRVWTPSTDSDSGLIAKIMSEEDHGLLMPRHSDRGDCFPSAAVRG
jgi:hypothetical protein